MLKQMSEFDTNTRLSALFKGWCALCSDTGAFLSAGNGRSKSENGHKYVLIVPNETLDERGGFFGDYTWDNPRRKFVRAWSEEEAIAAANKKLSKLVAAV